MRVLHYANAFLCWFVCVCMHAFMWISYPDGYIWCIDVDTKFVFILIVCWLRALLWSSAVRRWHERNALICYFHIASHILSILSRASPRPSQGMLLGWNRVEAMTWHTASVTPAGALSSLSSPSLRRMCVCVCVCVSVRLYNWKRDTVDAWAHVCVTVPEAERAESCHRRGGSHGRSPSFLLASFLLQKTHELRYGGACRPAHVFSAASFILFPSVWFIPHGVLKTRARQDSKGSVVMCWQTSQLFFAAPPPALHFPTTHHLPVTKCKQKLFWCLKYYSLFSSYFSSIILSVSSTYKSTSGLTFSLLLLHFSIFWLGLKKWTAWGLKRPRRSKNQTQYLERDF